MIKDIEKFPSDFEGFRLRDWNSLTHAYVEIVNARTVEKSPVGCPERSQRRIRSESLRQEVASGSGRCRTVRVNIARIHYLH